MSSHIISKFELHSLLGNNLDVYQNNEIIIKDLRIISIDDIQHIPPYDHFVMSFEATCRRADFTYIVPQNPIGSHSIEYIIKTNKMDIPVYIDSYKIEVPMINMISSNHPPNHSYTQGLTHSIINGHFDSRDFEDIITSCSKKLAIDERIKSRFDILDL